MCHNNFAISPADSMDDTDYEIQISRKTIFSSFINNIKLMFQYNLFTSIRCKTSSVPPVSYLSACRLMVGCRLIARYSSFAFVINHDVRWQALNIVGMDELSGLMALHIDPAAGPGRWHAWWMAWGWPLTPTTFWAFL